MLHEKKGLENREKEVKLQPPRCRPLKHSMISELQTPPEFAQPRLSRVKRRSSLATGYKSGSVCSYMAGHEDAGVVTGHTGTNTPKFVPPRWGRPPLDPTQTGLCKFGWGPPRPPPLEVLYVGIFPVFWREKRPQT